MGGGDEAAFDLDDPSPDRSRVRPSHGSPARRAGRRRWAVPAGVGAMVVLVVLAARVGREDPAPLPPTPIELLAVLATPAGADDALPEVGVEQPAVVASSTRSLGRTDDARYWTALDDRGAVCFVVLVDRVIPGFGARCAEPAEVAAGGVAMRVSVGGVVSDAVLVPDGFDAAALEAAGAVRVGTNLLVRPAPA